jgi:hypothetical protein
VKHSLSLLTACLIAALPAVASADPSYGSAVVATPANAPTAAPAPKTPTFRDRLRAAFGLPPLAKKDQAAQAKPAAQPTHPAEAPAITQASYSVYAPVTTPPAAPQGKQVTVQQSNLAVAPKFRESVGHENDYSWITGQLYYVHAEGGMWVVRYANVEEVDRYGGSVVLTPTVEMRNFREGDLVNVSGEIMNNGLPVRGLGSALYRVNSIQMVDRNDPPF